ncbi:MAG: hypothetical protein ACWGN7_01460 [Thermodesulfovibrionales bacterium]
MEILDLAVGFLRDHPVAAVVCGLIVLLLLVRYPKFILGIVLLLFLLVAAYYGIMSMATSGTTVKDKLLEKQQRQLEEVR